MENKNRFLFIVLMAGLLMLIGLFGMTACTPPERAKVIKAAEDEFYLENKDGIYYSLDITKFEYDGHDYIKFGSREYQTIVHDPDCKCHQKYVAQDSYEYEYTY